MPGGKPSCFVDTNVLLYLKDRQEPEKQAKARHWLTRLAANDRIVVSPQVLNEYAAVILKRFRHVTHAELAADLQAMQVWCLAPLTAQTPIAALAVHRAWGFSFFDSALIAAAHAFGCELFLSEDLHSGQHIGGLEIVNPFRAGPEQFEI